MGGGGMKKQNSMIYPVMENLAENLQGRGYLLLTRNLDPGKRYFSDDPENLVQPGIFCSLGQLKSTGTVREKSTWVFWLLKRVSLLISLYYLP